jgi:hypothetical protein
MSSLPPAPRVAVADGVRLVPGTVPMADENLMAGFPPRPAISRSSPVSIPVSFAAVQRCSAAYATGNREHERTPSTTHVRTRADLEIVLG